VSWRLKTFVNFQQAAAPNDADWLMTMTSSSWRHRSYLSCLTATPSRGVSSNFCLLCVRQMATVNSAPRWLICVTKHALDVSTWIYRAAIASCRSHWGELTALPQTP